MGDKPTSRKIEKISKNIAENNFARCVLRQLFTEVEVNSVDIYLSASRLGKYPPLFTSTSVNNCSITLAPV